MNLEITDNFLNKLYIPQNIQELALKKAKEGYVMALLELIPKVNIKRQIDEPLSELKNRKSLPRCFQYVSRNPY